MDCCSGEMGAVLPLNLAAKKLQGSPGPRRRRGEYGGEFDSKEDSENLLRSSSSLCLYLFFPCSVYFMWAGIGWVGLLAL